MKTFPWKAAINVDLSGMLALIVRLSLVIFLCLYKNHTKQKTKLSKTNENMKFQEIPIKYQESLPYYFSLAWNQFS